MAKLLRILKQQGGQTLIETMAAIFMLAMGIAAVTGLAIYALNSSTSITKQIIATGLAREGLEAVKNMRDTNWLQDTLSPSGTCYNYSVTSPTSSRCYQNWAQELYCIDPKKNNGSNNCNDNNQPTQATYILGFDENSPSYWQLQIQKSGSNYGLLLDPTDAKQTGNYTIGAGGTICADGQTSNGLAISDYCRQIVISRVTSPPYDKDTTNLFMLLVQSRVWWVDKKCPRSANWPGLGKCAVELDTYLTNWKNY